MRSRVHTSQALASRRGALRAVLVASGAVLALALVTVLGGLAEPTVAPATHGRASCQGTSVAHGGASSLGAVERQHPCMQPRAAALVEWAAILGTSPAFSLHQQVLAARGRVGFQPDTHAVYRAVRERQDAIITAIAHRMRDAPATGSAGHVADRPPIITRPLRGPPARS